MSPGKLDRAAVSRRLAALDKVLAHLRGLGTVGLGELEADLTLRWAVLHGLQLAAQACLDIAARIAVAEGHDVRDYADALDALGHAGVLDPDFGRAFRGIAGFRNVLVHEYLDVDLGVVHGVLSARLDDIETFAGQVAAWLARRGP